jgi:hypothetical protein
LAAQALLIEPSSSFEKFGAVKDLIFGISPKLDEALQRCEKDLRSVEQILGHDFFSFATENLPEATEEQKRRKKAVVFFWKTWNTLRGEVSRVQEEMNHADSSQDQVVKTGHLARIFNFAKGPFGVLTVAAVAIVSASAYTSVQITIENHGCPSMIPSSSMPNFIPGISFPTVPIASGGSGVVALPALPMTVDGTQKGTMTIHSLKFHMSIQLGDVKSVTFDGAELLGKSTDINLSSKKAHVLAFICE